MSEMKLPKFKSDEEEAAFWDGFDTAEILEKGEEVELEYKPEPEEEDICIRCGERMIERKRDIDVPGEEITIHAKEYYCPRCKKSRLGSAEAKRLSEILVGLLGKRGGKEIERDTEVYKDKEGYFVINFSLTGKIDLMISHISFKPEKLSVFIENLDEDKFVEVELEKALIKIEGIDIVEERYKRKINTREIQVSKTYQSTEEILDIPQIADSDIFRAIQILPGVSSLSDFSSGFYVRGGTPDQNQILLDEIDVYNPSHFGGIFSTFNTDAVESVELLKGGFPAKYGGHLSSVLDVTNLDGNRKHHQGVARISLISANSTIQGPWKIGKNHKGSYMASFRRTYLELLKKAFDLPDYYFYDGHAKITYDVTEKDKLSVSSYFGKDRLEFNFGFNMLIEWGNETFSTQWTHIFNPRLFSKFVLAGSHFNSLFDVEYESGTEYKRLNDIYDISSKNLFNYTPDDKHLIDFGLDIKYNKVIDN